MITIRQNADRQHSQQDSNAAVPRRRLTERAILVTVRFPQDTSWGIEEQLDELAQLTTTAGAETILRVTQNRDKPNPACYIGSGKAAEIDLAREELGATLAIFNNELSPAQQRNLEEIIGGKVIDRNQLILDIFAQRARTREGKLQVELAQLEYLLPRLVGMGDALSRLAGGIGTRGPGETKLEVDRRRIRRRIRDLKKSIEEVRTHRREQRKNRLKSGMPLVSIVGYTNAGKSTLLHALTGADVLVEDQLFATLDPTSRRVSEPNHQPFVVTDTVGFIRNLPHQLVAAFRATLEEVQAADILIHVVDASHPAAGKHIEAVAEALTELGVRGKPIITALNKLDIVNGENLGNLPPCLPHPVKLSARTGAGLEDLLNEVDSVWASQRSRIKVTIPYTQMNLVSLLHEYGMVISKEYLPHGIAVEAELDAADAELVLGRVDEIVEKS